MLPLAYTSWCATRLREPHSKQRSRKLTNGSAPAGCPPPLELYRLIEADAQQAARQVSCFQDIASDGCFSLGMIAEYEGPLERYGPWFYPRLFWEAGMIGQVLYLEAEAAGMRSTGIGCYFDDPMHEVLGLRDRTYQDLYRFHNRWSRRGQSTDHPPVISG